MHMEIVQLKLATPAEPDDEYDEDLHDVNAVIMDLCASLGDTHAFEFRVAGFGDERWPVDVTTDLATVVEQLPRVLAACKMGESFELSLFEQGIERTLEFVPQGHSFQVRCRSGTEWKPDPQTELMATEAVLAMLSDLKRSFCGICERLLPRTSAHPWFQEFAHGSI